MKKPATMTNPKRIELRADLNWWKSAHTAAKHLGLSLASLIRMAMTYFLDRERSTSSPNTKGK
jgi:hypothetical protein